MELVKAENKDMGPQGSWDVVGYISLGILGDNVDPFSEKYLQLVRPRACKMGGEAFTISMLAVNEVPGGKDGTRVNYAVLLPRAQPAAAPEAATPAIAPDATAPTASPSL